MNGINLQTFSHKPQHRLIVMENSKEPTCSYLLKPISLSLRVSKELPSYLLQFVLIAHLGISNKTAMCHPNNILQSRYLQHWQKLKMARSDLSQPVNKLYS